MSVRFVVGRAGSGKTWRCLDAVRRRLREDCVHGPRLLLIAPEQASFQMERALIETPDLPGFVRCEVLSFQRLAYRIFSETGVDPRHGDQTIGTLGRLMVLRKLIRQERSELRLLDRVANKPGLVQQLAGTITELMHEDVSPETLIELADKLDETDPLAAARVTDITRLYQAYTEYLIGDRLDPAQYLALAAERLGRCESFAGAEVWVDGFAGFTRQEYHLLVELARTASSVELSLLANPHASALTDTEYPSLSYSLFARTERTLVRLRHDLTASGVGPIEVVRLADRSPSRFIAPPLMQLEQHLFADAPIASECTDASTAVDVVEVADRRAEVLAAVAEVQRLTQESTPPMRYRDIAIIVRDLPTYHDMIASAMRAHNIPCFIDQRQTTAHHPLVELLRGMLAVAADNGRLDDVRLTLKTQLLPISQDDADLMENYLLACGISGLRAWQEPWTSRRLFPGQHDSNELNEQQQQTLDRINTSRRAWCQAMAPWLACLEDEAEQSGQQWTTRLYDALKALKVSEHLAKWANDSEADGRTAEADAHRQVWTDFVELLDEFVHALGDDVMTLPAFRETIEAGLAEFNLGLAPATLDEVLVGAIERSRHPNMRAVLLLGFDDQHFPIKRSEDALLGDAERDTLQAMGAEIGASRMRNLLDERMLTYIAMTRAGERLWISYPRCDNEGKPIQPSPFLPDVQAALPGLEVTCITDPYLDRSTRWLTDVGELSARLANDMRNRTELADESNLDARAQWNGIYRTVRDNTEWQATLQRCLSGLAYENTASLVAGTIDRAVHDPFTASVSRLEKYAACPFAHYANYLLGLEERAEAELAMVDLGTVCHAILEKFFGQLADAQQPLSTLEQDDIATRIDTLATEVLDDFGDDLIVTQSRNAYLLDRSRGHMQRVTYWQRRAANVGKFRPLAVEYPFGIKPKLGKAISLETPKGRVVYLRGYIDRVDIAELGDTLVGTVIDYKRTTSRTLNYAQVFHGLSLQLVGYLLALQQNGESLAGRPIVPVAAFYLPLLEAYETLKHPDQKRKTEYKWRGVADTAALSALDDTVEPGKPSEFFSARLKKDGTPYADSDLASREQLKALMAHVGKRMGELADGLLDGNVAIEPYRMSKKMPCTWCAYKSVCRFEIETQPPRNLSSIAKADVMKAITQEPEHDA